MSRLAANPVLVARLEQERQQKAGISGHKTGLPKKLLELFAPHPPLPFKDAIRKRKPVPDYSGVAQYVSLFAQPGDAEYEPKPEQVQPEPRLFRNPEMPQQARVEGPLKLERVIAKRKAAAKRADEAIRRGEEAWEPAKDPNVEGDPFKTLFVGRLSYDVTDKKLQREFEEYGPIRNVSLVADTATGCDSGFLLLLLLLLRRNFSLLLPVAGKPRGYAFIEYEHKEDMKNAYKMADGRKVEGRRVLVDVERGRTVPGWKPRRLGGGKGGDTRMAKEPKNPNRRVARGLAPTPAGQGLLAGPAATTRAPSPEPRPEPSKREERAPETLPPPPSAPSSQQWPVSSGVEDREREQTRDREKERERERPAREARDRADRGYVERARGDRETERSDRDRDRGERTEKSRDRDRERDRGTGRDRERDRDAGRDRDTGRDRDAGRDRDRDRDRGSKRERDRGADREAGEVDGDRHSKRHRDERERERGNSRRRERDM